MAGINIRKLALQNKPLADLIQIAFTEEEIAELVAAKTPSGKFIGVGYISEGKFTVHSDPAKAEVIAELEEFMASRTGVA